MSVTPHESAREFLGDENGVSTRGNHEEEGSDDMPQNLALGELDITSSSVSLKGFCTPTLSYPVDLVPRMLCGNPKHCKDDLERSPACLYYPNCAKLLPAPLVQARHLVACQ